MDLVLQSPVHCIDWDLELISQQLELPGSAQQRSTFSCLFTLSVCRWRQTKELICVELTFESPLYSLGGAAPE